MVENALDKCVMLLSADWFIDHWPTLGLSIDLRHRQQLQVGFRENVRQIISGAREYWLVSFSQQRVQRTRSMMLELLQGSGVGDGARERIVAIATGKSESRLDENTTWILTAITEIITGDSIGGHGVRLDPTIKQIVDETWIVQTSAVTEGFERACLDSQTEWDRYLRSLTPDLPTYLAEFASETADKFRFRAFWAILSSRLTSKQQDELLSVYSSAGKALTGEAIEVPAFFAE